jgi:hypothetical protein
LRLAGLAAALALAACAPQTAPLPAAPLPFSPSIAIVAEPVGPLPGQVIEGGGGRWIFAGGAHLTSADTSRLHGLSDLKVWPDGRLLAVGDQGDLLEAHLVLDGGGWLKGVAGSVLTPVIGDDGQPITSQGEREYDAEGIAEFANGDRLISLEQHDRIFFYRKGQAVPRLAPMPRTQFVFNKGMEALAAYPNAGADAYLVGIEATGEMFLCRVSASCAPYAKIDLEGLELTALQPLPGGRIAYLLRTYNPLTGNRIILKVVDAQGAVVDRLELARPSVVDNFEGLAAVPTRDGIRFYVISDDNFAASQRTLLMAFDWRAPTGR